MASYIVLDQQGSFPSASEAGKMVFGVNTSNQVVLTDSNGTNFNFGAGPLAYSTYTIDLQTGTYTITGSGIYRIFRGDNTNTNTITFPDPATVVGGTIILINNDTSANESGYFTANPNQPYSLGGGTQKDRIDYDQMFIIYSINGEWRGGKLASL